MSVPLGSKRPDTYPWRPCSTCGRVMPVNALPKHERTHGDPRLGLTPTLDEQARIVELYTKRGHSIASVARLTWWSAGTVRRVLDVNGVERRPRGGQRPYLSVDALLETTQLYGQGYSLARVGDALGINRETVRTRLVRAGVARRPSGGTSLKGVPRAMWKEARAR